MPTARCRPTTYWPAFTGGSYGITHREGKQRPTGSGIRPCAKLRFIYWVLVTFTNSTVPFWDAMTTAGSIVARWMLSRKYVEQWLVWLAVDLVTVGLYLYKGIPLTAGLYALYSALAVAGYLRWKAKMRA